MLDEARLTVREVSHDVFRSRVARHRDDGRHRVELADERGGRDTCVRRTGWLASRNGEGGRRDEPSRLGMTMSCALKQTHFDQSHRSIDEQLETERERRKRTISTRSYFCIFILLTALTPSTATSIWHPKTSRNLLLSLRQTASSSTSKTRGGTAQPGTLDCRRGAAGGRSAAEVGGGAEVEA